MQLGRAFDIQKVGYYRNSVPGSLSGTLLLSQERCFWSQRAMQFMNTFIHQKWQTNIQIDVQTY